MVRAEERLERQLAYLRSDERPRELARMAAEMSAEERLEQAWAMSRSGAAARGRVPDDLRERVDAERRCLPPDAAPVLRRLARRWC